MANPFLGEIRMIAGYYAPITWMFCEGQLLPISGFGKLFGLLGTTYGGDGQSTFALPDLRGRLPLHVGTNAGKTFVAGEAGGSETVTLTTEQMPIHGHALQATASGFQSSPAGVVPAQAYSTQPGVWAYGLEAVNPTSLHPDTILPAGANQPHTNLQPFLCLNFIIATEGIVPKRG
jgi:microcystin-dependent protein